MLLSPCELDPTMKMLLQVPMWAQRVIYIQGSALKDTDLARCRLLIKHFTSIFLQFEDRGVFSSKTIPETSGIF